MQKRDIEFLFFCPKRPLKSRILRFFLKTRFFLQKTLQIDDFRHFFLVGGRTAVRPFAYCLSVRVFFWAFFLSFFHEIPFKMAFLKLRYMTFFLTHATTLRTLISYFYSREQSKKKEESTVTIRTRCRRNFGVRVKFHPVFS